ncbi:hypothetical protein GAP32_418 [Cronobacter phage vB_CsaM_GAP32]|uniref:Uncharacterized protein n=1 Tax=Cronobacter phage vB_CsaM_GAP32 TaxID=1141136 RepID=K4F6I0_9CAUD|nr:hypothetical protein GAP32_418 [Cronobacter phage vB_CsaM_GAP32]AFC21871.1 hypothetical protein GAP32_418 [Cronobacter phage vB_CsaM_GAP32]
MRNGIGMRIQIMPGGIVIGHVIPSDHPANNGVIELIENHVYELRGESTFDTTSFHDIGEADVKMFDIESGGCSLDKFIALAGGKHLTVNNGK